MIDGPGVQMLTEESLRPGGVVEDLLRATPAGGRGRASMDPTVLQALVSWQAEVLEWGGGGIPRVMYEAWDKSDAAPEQVPEHPLES